jgi:hypothetical protein
MVLTFNDLACCLFTYRGDERFSESSFVVSLVEINRTKIWRQKVDGQDGDQVRRARE